MGQGEGQAGRGGLGEEVPFAGVQAQECQEEGDSQKLGEDGLLVLLGFEESHLLRL